METNDILHSLQAQHRLPAAVRTEFEAAIALAKRFNAEVMRPAYLAIDRRVQADNDYLPADFVAKANEWGFYTKWIPKLFGGDGMNMLSLYPFMEELSTVCAGLANLIGVHYLGVSVLSSSGNARVVNRILREVVRESKAGRPCLLSLAWTEPGAGTDQFEAPLLDGAKVRTLAKRVEGGYKVSGNKVFISAGHLSTYHMLIAYEDARRPADTLVMAAVKTGTPGFSFGTKEHKMGQKACVASELVFDDVFVPDADVCFSPAFAADIGITPRTGAHKIISLFPAVSKPGVGALAAGIARGATDAALAYATQKRIGDGRLADQQWAQMALADMQAGVLSARTLYMEAAYAVSLKSMLKMLFTKPLFYASKLLPGAAFSPATPAFELDAVNRAYGAMTFSSPAEDETLLSGLGALSKFACSDIAVRTCTQALELMGPDGTRHEYGVEKSLRDAKLLQIYEGANEVARVNVFYKLLSHRVPDARVFDRPVGGKV